MRAVIFVSENYPFSCRRFWTEAFHEQFKKGSEVPLSFSVALAFAAKTLALQTQVRVQWAWGLFLRLCATFQLSGSSPLCVPC